MAVTQSSISRKAPTIDEPGESDERVNILSAQTKYQVSRANAHEEAVKRVISAMLEHLDEPLSLHDMANIAYYSPFHFNRIFKKTTGIPPIQFLYALRLKRAKDLLLTTDLSVTTICLDVGYNSIGSFTNRFTELVGLSPDAFRRLPQAFDSLHHLPIESLLPSGPENMGASAGPNGRIRARPDFKGVIFVGLSSCPAPDSTPVQCKLLTQSDRFEFASVPPGTYYVTALGLPWHTSLNELLTLSASHHARSGPITIDELVPAPRIELTLRPPHLLQPQILSAVPLLVLLKMASSPGRGRKDDKLVMALPLPLTAERRFQSLLGRV